MWNLEGNNKEFNPLNIPNNVTDKEIAEECKIDADSLKCEMRIFREGNKKLRRTN